MPCWWPQDFGYEMSLNDVCCYIPAWFGVLACVLTNLRRQQEAPRRPCCAPASPDRDLVTHRRTLFTYGLAYEAFQSPNVAVTAAGIMSILPAHLMRSVSGEFDNECVRRAQGAAGVGGQRWETEVNHLREGVKHQGSNTVDSTEYAKHMTPWALWKRTYKK